ncbi:MAG: hypothetical protein DRP87_07970 [Spirochaetes bacterium]|nr:MAG: hypothetical protein DRP87_07970 [Spirochaetota bacterium]
MQEFDFVKAKSLDHACTMLAGKRGRAKVIAGGTDLMIGLRNHRLSEEVDTIMDISGVGELAYIREEGELIRIGAGTTHAELALSSILWEAAPVLSMAAKSIGSPQIRNRGTIGGNIITSAPCADTVPALLVLDAALLLRRGESVRQVQIADFFEGPYRVKAAEDELLLEISFRRLRDGAKSLFDKLTRRNALAKARMNIAVIALQDKNKVVKDLRISLGSTTPIPCRFTDAERLFLGKVPRREDFLKAGQIISSEMVEKSGYRWSTDYKKPVVEALTAAALKRVLKAE